MNDEAVYRTAPATPGLLIMGTRSDVLGVLKMHPSVCFINTEI